MAFSALRKEQKDMDNLFNLGNFLKASQRRKTSPKDIGITRKTGEILSRRGEQVLISCHQDLGKE